MSEEREEGVHVVRYKRLLGDGSPIVPDVRAGGLVEDFSTWLRSRDQRPFLYHKGYLAIDRERNYELDVVAQAALIASGVRLPEESEAQWKAREREARVDLVQRRVAPGVFVYWARKRAQKRRRKR